MNALRFLTVTAVALLLHGTGVAQNNAIFYGGPGDGFSRSSYTQSGSTTPFLGGEGDGYARNNYVQSGSTVLFLGGEGDGYARNNYVQSGSTSLFLGGEGDGFTRSNYVQPGSTALFLGGQGDGYAWNNYSQNKPLPMYYGGPGDGYAFTAIPVVPLPVSWLGFRGDAVAEGHRLVWEVAGISAGESYTLEHSASGQHFGGLYTTEKQPAASRKTFAYVNTHPETGNNYYRVKALAPDGKVSYSSVVVLRHLAENRSLTVFPNPAATVLNVHLTGYNAGQKVQLRMLDLSGRLVLERNYESAQDVLPLDISSLAAGRYLLQVKCGEEVQPVPVLKMN